MIGHSDNRVLNIRLGQKNCRLKTFLNVLPQYLHCSIDIYNDCKFQSHALRRIFFNARSYNNGKYVMEHHTLKDVNNYCKTNISS
jgi:hypothetical protein